VQQAKLEDKRIRKMKIEREVDLNDIVGKSSVKKCRCFTNPQSPDQWSED
jgi:hypothetical protein